MEEYGKDEIIVPIHLDLSHCVREIHVDGGGCSKEKERERLEE